MITFKLLGSAAIWIDESEETGFSTKALALLIYLAQTQTPQSRTHIANLLWTDKHDSQALANLRGILHEIKLMSENHQIRLLESNRKTLQLCSATRFEIDSHVFASAIQQTNDVSQLQHATDHYRGDFVSGFRIRGATPYDDWITRVRTHLHDQYIKTLENIAIILIDKESPELAIPYLQTIIQNNPYREDIHLQLMTQFVSSGQRANAIVQFEHCREILATELNTNPSTEIQRYYQQLIDGQHHTRTDPPLRSHKNTAHHKFIVGPPINSPEHFFGREDYLTRIFGWWQQPPLGHVAIIGQRRSGKTSLLKHLQPISGNCPQARGVTQKTNWLPDADNYRWIFVDFQDPRMRTLSGLLSHLLNGFDIDTPDHCTLEQFMDLATENPWTVPTIILIDELDAGLAADELDQPFWWAMRALTQMTDGFIGIVVASYEQPMRAADRLDKSSPFFNIFSTVELGPFEEHEAIEFIDNIDEHYSHEEREWILEHSGRWPCLLQLLCQEKYLATRNNTGTEQWRDNALHQLQQHACLLQ